MPIPLFGFRLSRIEHERYQDQVQKFVLCWSYIPDLKLYFYLPGQPHLQTVSQNPDSTEAVCMYRDKSGLSSGDTTGG